MFVNKSDIKNIFIDNTKNHEMNVLLNNGLYRHIRFKDPETIDYYFDLVTWPGHLVICGDIGTYHFSRARDMFEFFRDGERDFNHKHVIEECYWSGKLQGVPRNAYREFSFDLFSEIVNDNFNEYVKNNELDFDQKVKLGEENKEILSKDIVDEHEAYMILNEFSSDCTDFTFRDLWDYDFTNYKFNYILCCYAIVWGIIKYNQEFDK
jgi:hypothetical protein